MSFSFLSIPSTSAAILSPLGGTFEDRLGSFSDHLPILSVPVKDPIDFALIRDLILEHDVLVLHIIEVPEAHPAGDH